VYVTHAQALAGTVPCIIEAEVPPLVTGPVYMRVTVPGFETPTLLEMQRVVGGRVQVDRRFPLGAVVQCGVSRARVAGLDVCVALEARYGGAKV
jgi:hypothetical protein